VKSSELASLAGVTTRALRHYHQVGVLPEPARGPNGYRHYEVRDLIRLLRIKRLAALGMSLDQMVDVLDSDEADHHDLLLDLEHEVDAQIARLMDQKALIGLIRTHRAAPNLPPELVRLAGVVSSVGLSSALKKLDREHSRS
jgi:DNA-binding transcriptional MerR regulator